MPRLPSKKQKRKISIETRVLAIAFAIAVFIGITIYLINVILDTFSLPIAFYLTILLIIILNGIFFILGRLMFRIPR